MTYTMFWDTQALDAISIGDVLIAKFGDDVLTPERQAYVQALVADGVLTPLQMVIR